MQRLPNAESLMEGTDGVLYGVASQGGSSEMGTVFRLNRDGTGYRQLHTFGQVLNDGHLPAGRLLGPNIRGTVFKVSKDGTAYAVLKRFAGSDGDLPSGALWEGNFRAIYGSTQIGGRHDKGVLFKE